MRKINISYHAIDRASTRVNNTWVSDSQQADEGLVQWLTRKTNEALDSPEIDAKGYYKIDGMKLRIVKTKKNKEEYALITVMKEGE